jgi:hypothetical protein
MQMLQEAMLLKQSFSIAHAAMMPLDEHRAALSRHHAGRGKRPRAYAQNLQRLAALGKLTQQRTDFLHRQWRPVGFHQRAVHSVCLHRCAHRKIVSLQHAAKPSDSQAQKV